MRFKAPHRMRAMRHDLRRFALSLAVLVGSATLGCSSPSSSATTGSSGAVDYRSALVTSVAGTYSGTCLLLPESTATTASVVLSAAGHVTTSRVDASLLGANVLITFKRDFDTTGTSTHAEFNASDLDAIATNVGLVSDDDPERAQVRGTVGTTANGILCSHSADTASLRTKSVYASVARFLASPTRKLDCVTGDRRALTLDYQVGGGEAQLGTESFSLDRDFTSELASALNSSGELVYQLETRDGRTLNIRLDRAGALSVVGATLKDGSTLNCVPR